MRALIQAWELPSLPVKPDRVWLALAAIYAALFIFLREEFAPTAEFAATAVLETGPFILFAALLVGWLKATSAESLIARLFQGQGFLLIVAAAMIGGLAPFCSCEVIPFVAALLGAGVPVSVVMAFWLSSPLMDPAALTITAASLGWHFAFAKMVAAVAVGIFGGLALKAVGGFAPALLHDPLKKRGFGGCGCGVSLKADRPVWFFWQEQARRIVFREEMLGNCLFLLKWLAIAYTLEALMIRYVPAELVASLVGGDGVAPILTAALIGAPAYLNGYAAPAIVEGFMQQGMSAGAAMTFLIAGGVTSIPAMTAVFALVRVRLFAFYIFLGFTGAVLSGLIFALPLVRF